MCCKDGKTNEYLGGNFSLQVDKIEACNGPWRQEEKGRCYTQYTCLSCGSYYNIDSGD